MKSTVTTLPAVRMVCPSCGVGAGCNCGVAPITRAEYALLQNPEKSDRAIAAELGIGNATVSRARRKSTVSRDTVNRRVGRDGKARRIPVQKISETELDAAGKRIKAEMDEVETADTQAIEAMIAARQNPGDDRTGARRRDAIRRVGDTLAWELRNAGIRGVLRARKNPQAQAAAYQKAAGVLMRFQVLLDLARAAP